MSSERKTCECGNVLTDKEIFYETCLQCDATLTDKNKKMTNKKSTPAKTKLEKWVEVNTAARTSKTARKIVYKQQSGKKKSI